MRYVDTNTLEILSFRDIQIRFPHTSFPSGTPDLTEFGFATLQQVPIPTYNSITHGVQEVQPVQAEDNLWYQTWEVYELSSQEVIANQAAYEQNLREIIVNAVMKRLDDFAATRNYSNIFSACTYVTSTVPKFQQEATYCVAARDATWVKCYEILAEVEAETRPIPSSYEDIEAELPVLSWPA